MSKRLLLVFSAAMLLIGECVQAPEIRESQVHIFATDLTGAPISDIVIELTPASGGGDAIRTNTKDIRVVYGDYQLRASARGFVDARREVRIHQPAMLVRIELPVGSIGCTPPPAEIRGRLKHGNTTSELWVKATPVRGIGGGETRVTKAGSFLISGLEYSTYIITVMDGESILHQEIVKTYPVGSSSSKLEIDLTRRN